MAEADEITDVIILFSGSGWFWGRLRRIDIDTWVLHERISSDFPDRDIAEIFKDHYGGVS